MTSFTQHAGRTLLVLGLVGVPMVAHAHAVAGARLFPATLTLDDPGVADELSLPTFTRSIGSDGVSEHDVGFELDKTITERLAVIVSDTYSHFGDGRGGVQDVGLGAKYRLDVDAEHEFILSVGLSSEVGGTGTPSIADRFSTLGPQLYAGKGFGDLPRSLDPLRPFALTTQVGFGIPTSGVSVTRDADGGPTLIGSNPTILNWAFSLQYSLLYLNESVHPIDGPDVVKRLIPTVELSLQTPIANVPHGGQTTTGTLNPGVFYEADSYQIGVEALLPINETSGKHPGVVAQLHVFLEDVFPQTLGRPIFGDASDHDDGEGEAHGH